MNKKVLSLWITALFISTMNTNIVDIYKYFIPLIIAFLVITLYKTAFRSPYISYFLFFSISVTNFLGYTETLTGSHAASKNLILFGLSFYSVSLAYLISKNGRLNFNQAFQVANPLILTTGPIALFFSSIKYKKLNYRVNYFLPFIIVGVFFYQIVASPLTNFFFLIERTDAISAILFAFIFEIFVYMNFCGLSLIIYGLFGILGYRIPLNFKQPFSSRNVIEFWRGWHTSLSIVLKSLFYYPLKRHFPQFFTLLGVYLASALWHGVTFNFVLWGSFHATIFWLSLIALKRGNKLIPLILLPIAMVIGRLIFAERNTEHLLEKLSFNLQDISFIDQFMGIPRASILALAFGILLILVEFIFKDTSMVRKRNYKYMRTPIILCLIVFLGCFLAGNVGENYAVYGQR